MPVFDTDPLDDTESAAPGIPTVIAGTPTWTGFSSSFVPLNRYCFQLRPCGRGPRGTLLFTQSEPDEFVAKRLSSDLLYGKRHVTLGQKGVYDETKKYCNKIPGSMQNRRRIISDSIALCVNNNPCIYRSSFLSCVGITMGGS